MIDSLIKGLQNFKQWRHDCGHCYWKNIKQFRTTMSNGFDTHRSVIGQECSMCSKRRSVWIPKLCGHHIPTPYDDCHEKAMAWIGNE